MDHKTIVEAEGYRQIKSFVADMKSDESMKEMRNTKFVRGYQACLDSIARLIKMVEEMKGGEKPDEG